MSLSVTLLIISESLQLSCELQALPTNSFISKFIMHTKSRVESNVNGIVDVRYFSYSYASK